MVFINIWELNKILMGNKRKCDNGIQKVLTLVECKEALPVQVEELQEDLCP